MGLLESTVGIAADHTASRSAPLSTQERTRPCRPKSATAYLREESRNDLLDDSPRDSAESDFHFL